jgi:hypothetical protein
VHIPYEAEILFVARSLTYGLPPFFYQLKNSVLHTRRDCWRAFGEAADKLVEKLLGTDLKVEGVSAVFDANVE